MKILLLFSSCLFISVAAWAQQDPLYAQYINNPLLINPAYSGSTTDFNASVMYRKQWAGFDGSPVTMNANAHMALSNNRMGAGLIVLQDQVGVDKTTEVTFTYGYHIRLSDVYTLSLGLQGSVINYYSDYTILKINPADTKFTNTSEWKPNVGTGFLLRSDKLMVGFSVPKLLKAETQVQQFSTGLYSQHAYGFAAYVFPLSYRIKLKPWILARRIAGAPLSFDYAAAIKVDDSYSLGIFSRNFTTYGAFAQLNLGDHFRVAYVFELPTSKSVGTKYTTHELTLGLRLKVLNFHNLETIRDF